MRLAAGVQYVIAGRQRCWYIISAPTLPGAPRDSLPASIFDCFCLYSNSVLYWPLSACQMPSTLSASFTSIRLIFCLGALSSAGVIYTSPCSCCALFIVAMPSRHCQNPTLMLHLLRARSPPDAIRSLCQVDNLFVMLVKISSGVVLAAKIDTSWLSSTNPSTERRSLMPHGEVISMPWPSRLLRASISISIMLCHPMGPWPLP